MEEPSAAAAGQERAPAARLSAAESAFRDARRKPEPKSLSQPFESPLFRGNPSFSPQDQGGAPALCRIWKPVGCSPWIQLQFSSRDDPSYLFLTPPREKISRFVFSRGVMTQTGALPARRPKIAPRVWLPAVPAPVPVPSFIFWAKTS